MHAKLTANLIAKRSEERNKKTGKEEGVSQNLSEMDYLKALAPKQDSKNKYDLSRCITFETRMVDNEDPLLFGVSIFEGEESKFPSVKTLSFDESMTKQKGRRSSEEFSFFNKRNNLISPKIANIRLEENKPIDYMSSFNSQRSGGNPEENIGTDINLITQRSEDCLVGKEEQRITPRERWQRAIKKIIVLRKFNMLNENLKVDAKLYGRVTETVKPFHIPTSCIILPESSTKILWSIIMVLALIFTAIYIPIRISFFEEISLGLLIFEFVVDGIFILDLGVNFFSAYYDKNKRLVTKNKDIILHYLKGWFFLDLIACFPFGVLDNSDNQNGMGYNRLLRLIRLSRLYRIIKIFNLLRVLDLLKKSKTYEKFLIAMKMNTGIKRLIKTIFTFFLVMHFFGCFWFFVARFNDFEPDTWVTRNGIRDMPPMHQYLISFCWVMTLSTIGYGDIIPFTKTERFISLFYIIVGVGFVSYSIGSLSSIMLSSDSKKQKYKEKILVLDELAMNLKMNGDLYYKIKSIIRNNHETHFYSDMSHDTLLEELPTSLRSELITLIYQQNNLGVIAFFHGKDPEFLNEIMPHLRRITLEKDEIIYRDGDWADEMYFILSGSIKLVSDENYIFRTYIAGSYFGECEIIRKTDFRNESAIANESCELLTLRKTDLNKLLEAHQTVKEQFITVMNKRETKNVESLEKARKASIRLEGLIQEKLNCGQKSIFNAAKISKVDKRRGSIWRRMESQKGLELELPVTEIISEEESNSSSSDSDRTPVFRMVKDKGGVQQNFEKVIEIPDYEIEGGKQSEGNSIELDHYSFTSEERDKNQKMGKYNFVHNACKLNNPHPNMTLSKQMNNQIVISQAEESGCIAYESIKSKFEISPLISREESKEMFSQQASLISENKSEISSFSVSVSERGERNLPTTQGNIKFGNKLSPLSNSSPILSTPTRGKFMEINSMKREFYRLKKELNRCQKMITEHKNYDINRWRELREDLFLRNNLGNKPELEHTNTGLSYVPTNPNRRGCNAVHSLDYREWLRRKNIKNT